jgi:hypothetical protein
MGSPTFLRMLFRSTERRLPEVSQGAQNAGLRSPRHVWTLAPVDLRPGGTSGLVRTSVRNGRRFEERERRIPMGFVKALIHPQVLRTCMKCGSSWSVPRYYTRRHSQGGSMAPLAGSGGGITGAMAAMTGLTAETMNRTTQNGMASAQVRSAFSMCPQCGSNLFTSKRLRNTSIVEARPETQSE